MCIFKALNTPFPLFPMNPLRASLCLGLLWTLVACLAPPPAAETPPPPPDPLAETPFTSGVIQVGVVVSDLEAALTFYQEVIGMQRTGGFDIEADFAQRSGLSRGEPFSVAVLKLADSPQATEWKLMSFGREAGHPRPANIQDDTGMQYITINVRALQPFIDRIQAAGIPFLGETPTPLRNGRHFVLVQDPDGTFVELIGPLQAASN